MSLLLGLMPSLSPKVDQRRVGNLSLIFDFLKLDITKWHQLVQIDPGIREKLEPFFGGLINFVCVLVNYGLNKLLCIHQVIAPQISKFQLVMLKTLLSRWCNPVFYIVLTDTSFILQKESYLLIFLFRKRVQYFSFV